MEPKLPKDTNILLSMRNQGMTLQAIADVYGVSREAIRKKIGNTGRSHEFIDRVSEIASMRVVPSNLSDRLRNAVSGVLKVRLGRIKTTNSGSNVYKGENGEVLVSNKLSELGIKNKLAPRKYYCDIILANGKTIDVKSASKPSRPPSMRGSGDYYRFGGARKRQKRHADYFIFVIPSKNAFFVVPLDKVIGFENVTFTYPKQNYTGAQKVEWQKYQDRFDLLK